MNKKNMFVIILLLLFLFSSDVYSRTVKNHSKHIKIAVFSNAQPAIFVDENGKAAGIFPDILYEILTQQGYYVEFVIFDTFQAAYLSALSGDVDIMPALIKTDEREIYFDYGKISFLVSWSQIFAHENNHFESVFDLRNKRIGVQTSGQNGKNFDTLMKSFDISYVRVEFNTFDEITAQIESGDIDAGVYFSTYFNRELKAVPTNIIFSPSNSYVAVPKGKNAELLKLIDKSLAEAKADQKSYYYSIMKKYLMLYNQKSLPGWVVILLISLAGLFLISTVFIIILRFLVNKTTHNLLLEKERAEESDRLKTSFLTKISHELLTPLNGIMGMHELLAHTDLEGEKLIYLELAKESAFNLNIIIQDLLDFQSTAITDIEAAMNDIDIVDAIKSVLPTMIKAADSKGLELTFNYSSEHIFWKTDKKLLYQALIQLVSNSINFSEKGTISISVLEGESLDIIIKDNGIGIDGSSLEEIFIPFHQLENPFTRIQGGLGVGLSIVRQVCSKINGEFIITSEPNAGTEAIIRLFR